LSQDIPLASFSRQLGASLAEGGASITFAGQDCGFVVFGPYLPFKIGLYTFVVDILFPSCVTPKAFIDIYGNGVVFASQRISTHCHRIRIQAYVSAECKLELRLHSDRTPFEIKRVTYALGADAAALGAPSMAREQLRGTLAWLLNAETISDAPQGWGNSEIVANALFGDNHFQIVPLLSLYEHEGVLRQAGIMPAVIQAFFDQNNRELVAGVVPGDLVNGFPKLTNAFQQRIIASGYLELMSPYDGSLIRTQNSIPVPINDSILPIVYEFQGENPIVVGVGTGWTGAVSFIWLVKHDIIVVHDVVGDWTSPEQVISRYLAFCVENAQQVSAYRKTTHTPALASGFNTNLGHYFWNETSGVERLIRLTGLNGVQTIYSPQSRWLSVKEIFASEQLPPVVELDDWGRKVPSEVLSQNEILVHPTGTQYDDGLALKVRRAAEMRFFTKAPERWQRAKELTSDGQYVLYVNLRSHNKAWVEQDEGIVEIVRALRSAYEGEIVVYLDGYSDCESSALKISSTPIDGVTYVIGIMGLHVDFAETLYWAYRSDFFVAVIGSGLVPLTWLANAPGICYAETAHLAQMSWWQWVRNNMAPIGWPASDQIRNVVDQVNSNYSIDIRTMVELFLKVWRQTRAEPA
jgi:hypothetical protein